MHNKYGKDGLEVISVTLDDPGEKDARQSVLSFLQKQKFPFTTVNLDPKTIDTKRQLKEFSSYGVPMIYVFNRDNLYVKKLPLFEKDELKEEVDYDVVAKIIDKLMKK